MSCPPFSFEVWQIGISGTLRCCPCLLSLETQTNHLCSRLPACNPFCPVCDSWYRDPIIGRNKGRSSVTLLIIPPRPRWTPKQSPWSPLTATTMTALPPLSEVEKWLDENGQSAWGRLLEAEKFALAHPGNAPSTKYNDLLVGARVIGFFVLDFRKHNRNISFAERTHHKLVQQVHSCWGSSSAEEEECLKKLIDLGTHWQNHLIRACMLRLLLSRDPV